MIAFMGIIASKHTTGRYLLQDLYVFTPIFANCMYLADLVFNPATGYLSQSLFIFVALKHR